MPIYKLQFRKPDLQHVINSCEMSYEVDMRQKKMTWTVCY